MIGSNDVCCLTGSCPAAVWQRVLLALLQNTLLLGPAAAVPSSRTRSFAAWHQAALLLLESVAQSILLPGDDAYALQCTSRLI